MYQEVVHACFRHLPNQFFDIGLFQETSPDDSSIDRIGKSDYEPGAPLAPCPLDERVGGGGTFRHWLAPHNVR